jgi:hypothetical protein
MPTLCRQSIFRSKPIFRSPLRSVIVCVKGCVSIRPLMRTLFSSSLSQSTVTVAGDCAEEWNCPWS